MSLPDFYRLVSRDRIGSTSDEAKRLAAGGAAEGTLIWALQQTRGHGRYSREWVSPRGNFYGSVVLRPKVAVAMAAQLGFVAALSVADACLDLAPGAAISFKWPNDVLLAGRKVAGVLLESQAEAGGGLAWLVVGVGINLVTYPVNAAYPATALSATGADLGPDAMLAAWAENFLRRYRQWDEGRGFAALREAWLERAERLGQEIWVRLPKAEFPGIFAGLDADGALLLETGSGRRRVEAGEVFPAS